MSSRPALPRSSRRQFLATTAVASAAALLPGCRTVSDKRIAGKTLFGSQLYGWGQYYRRDGKDIADHLPEVLSALEDCGYDYAETNLQFAQPGAAERFAELARKHRLGVHCFYTGGRLHEREAARQTIAGILAAARKVQGAGVRVINCNPDPIGREKTDEELLVQAAALTKLGEGLGELGIKLGVHNHTPEMKNGAREFHSNFKYAPPEVVGFCYDVHWVYRGGVQPIYALGDYGDRVVSWHLRQSRGGIWWEDLDEGDVDYGAVAILARPHPAAPLYTVELAIENGTKITRSVVENHRRSLHYARRKFTG
jgi:inosose dehydratase